MTSAPRGRAAFSLVEVIIAVGIVAVAIVGMMALISSLLSSARETAAQNEALQYVPSVNDYLQKSGFTNVYSLIVAGTNQTPIYAYAYGGANVSQSNQTKIVVTPDASAVSADTTKRSGRLFRLLVSFSTNNPAGFTTVQPMTNYTNFALTVRVDLNSVPNVSVPRASNNLVFSYETAVFR